MVTVNELLQAYARKQENRTFVCKIGDKEFHGEELPLTAVIDMTDSYDTKTAVGGFELAKELCYMTFPIFRSAELAKTIDCKGEPHNVVEMVLTNSELTEMINYVSKLYDTKGDKDAVKKR